jgi:hypothetical protein
MSIEIDSQIPVPGAPYGTRIIGTAASYELIGARIRASGGHSPASDWLSVGHNGIGAVDGRALLETDDGACICMKYSGRLVFTDDGARVITAPTFETGDERYSWLNSIQAVAYGRRRGKRLEYELFSVEHDDYSSDAQSS